MTDLISCLWGFSRGCAPLPLIFPLSLYQLQSSSNPDPPCEPVMTKSARDPADKPKDLPLDKASTVGREATEDGVVVIAAGTPSGTHAPPTTTTSTSKPGSPAAMSQSPSATDQKRPGLDVTSQGVQTTATSTFSGPKHEEKEEKKEAVQEWVDRRPIPRENQKWLYCILCGL